MLRIKHVSLCLALAGASGCVGVPRLYAPPEDERPEDASHKPDSSAVQPRVAPKVSDIVTHLACELRNAALENKLGGRNYVVTVFLTLQVEDAVHATPSLSFVDPLKAEGTSLTLLVSGDLGGERKRTFTTTYYLGTKHLLANKAMHDATCDRAKLYSLDGNLGLEDILRDGIGAYALRYGKDQVGKDPNPSVDKNTFGSRVIFVVNKSLGALGPTWSLKRFKGPGGSGGLLNAKRLNTDDLIVTFALQAADVTSQAAVVLAEKNLGAAKDAVSEAEKNLRAAKTAVDDLKADADKARAVLAGTVNYSTAQKQRQERALAQDTLRKAEEASPKATRAQQRAQQELDAKTLQQDAAEKGVTSARDSAQREQAVKDGQDLLNSMILQSLQPR